MKPACPPRSRIRSSGVRPRTSSASRISRLLVATTRRFTRREQLAALRLGQTSVVRETRTLGASGSPIAWRDTRADLVRRAAKWRSALQAGGVRPGDRVLLRLPAFWAIGGDCLLALLDMD